MGFVGEAAVLDVVDVLAYGIDDGLMEIGIGLDEFRAEAIAHAQEVRADQDLAIGAIASPDADGSRRMQGFGDFRGDVRRDTFQCDGEGTGFFQLQGVGNQLLSCFAVLALDAEAAELMDGLRRQADVADDGDTGRRHGFDGFADTGATFELDSIAARFFHEPAGIVQGLLGAFLIAHEGHIADDQSPFDAADDSLRMVDHIFHGHRQCRRMTHDDIAQGIADKDHVDTGFIDVLGHDVIISRNHGNRRAFLFHFLNGQIGYFLVHGELLPPSQGFLSACHAVSL